MSFPRTARSLVALVLAGASLGPRARAQEPRLDDVVSHERLVEALRGAQVLPPLTPGTWYGNVLVLPYRYGGSYDREVGGNLNVEPRQWVARSVLSTNADNYDLLVVVTNFDFASGPNVQAFYWPIKNEVTGIGMPLLDSAAAFGSQRLQGYVDAKGLASYLTPEGTLDASRVEILFNHEIEHRWGARSRFLDAGQPSSALLGLDGIHWSYLLDSNASYLYGSKWIRNADGTYTTSEIQRRYSDLDLYLMGLAPREEVEPFTLLVNPAISPNQLPHLGDSIQATARTITVDDVIAAEGPRTPGYASSPKELKVALVYLVTPDSQLPEGDLALLEQMRSTWQAAYFQQTRGRGVVGVGFNAAQPGAGGTFNQAAAVTWLRNAAAADGHWEDSPTTAARETALALEALSAVGGNRDPIQRGYDALATLTTPGTELLARQVESLALGQRPTESLRAQLLAAGSTQSGWGAFPRYQIDAVSTARAFRALARLGGADPAPIADGLTGLQNADGGWGWRKGSPSAVLPTLEVLLAARVGVPGFWTKPWVQQAVSWLLPRQLADGGFGDAYSDVPETALFLLVADGQPVDPQKIAAAVAFLGRLQRSDGSWEASRYKTAIALAALAPTLLPDPNVNPAELFFQPAAPYAGDALTLTIAVRSVRAALPAGTEYRWELLRTDDASVAASFGGTLPAIAADGLFVLVTPWTPAADPGTYTLRFTIDPEHKAGLRDRGNDTASVPLALKVRPPGIDLRLAGVTATPASLSGLPQTTRLAGALENAGRTPASNAVLSAYDGDPSTGPLLGSANLNVGAEASTPFQIDVSLTQARAHTLTLVADPADVLGDADRSNNRTAVVVPLQARDDPEVLSLTPAPGTVFAGETVTLTAQIHNKGTNPVSGATLAFTYTQGSTEVPISLASLDTLAPNETRTIQATWRPSLTGSVPVAATVDPSSLIPDADRTNNRATSSVSVSASTLPNLTASSSAITFNPTSADPGQVVHVTAVLTNTGATAAGPFLAQLWRDAVGTGVRLVEVNVPGLAAGASVNVEADWTADGVSDRAFYAVGDSAAAVSEFNEEDNTAFAVLHVRTPADLEVTGGGLTVTPPFPVSGQSVRFDVLVFNRGDLSASAVPLELLDSTGAVLVSTSLASVPAHGSAAASLTTTLTGSGELTLTIRVNGSRAISESRYDNNSLAHTVSLQGSDLYASNRFLSPNGDGAQDTTTIYVANGASSVEILTAAGTLVRTLTLAPGSSSVVWDGRADDGQAVRDGPYIARADGGRIGLTVDINGSALGDDPRARLLTQLLWGGTGTGLTAPGDGALYILSGGSLARYVEGGGTTLGTFPGQIQGAALSGRLFVSSSGLVSYPGPVTTPLTVPSGFQVTPWLSPNGQYLLWITGTNAPARLHLQNLVTPALSQTFGPFTTNPTTVCGRDITWSQDGSRAYVSLLLSQGGPSRILVVRTAGTLAVDEVFPSVVEPGCPAFSAGFDFLERQAVWYTGANVRSYDLDTGLLVESASSASGSVLSSRGDVLYTGTEYIRWRTGERWPSQPQQAGYLPGGTWSQQDRRLYNIAADPGRPTSFTIPFEVYETTSTVNLSVSLRPRVLFGNAGVDLVVLAADRDLDRFVLEYADAATPTTFLPIGVGREPIYGTSWGAWLPPRKGRFLIRLTVYDRAGSSRQVSAFVSWAGLSDIAGLSTDGRFISPLSSPGVKDALVASYTVLRPANLLFEIREAVSGRVVKRIAVAAPTPGPATTTWDGLDDGGLPVPDGDYLLAYLDNTWPVTVDNRPPAVGLEATAAELVPACPNVAASLGSVQALLARDLLAQRIAASIREANLEAWSFQTRTNGQSGAEWITRFRSQTELLPTGGAWRVEPPELFLGQDLRILATDLAGNQTVIERTAREDRIAFTEAEPGCRRSTTNRCTIQSRPAVDALTDEAGGRLDQATQRLDAEWDTFLVQSTVWGASLATLRLEYRLRAVPGLPPAAWQSGVVRVASTKTPRSVARILDPADCLGSAPLRAGKVRGSLTAVYWDHPGLPLQAYEVRLLLTNREGQTIASPATLFVPEFPLSLEQLQTDRQGAHFRVTNLGVTTLRSIEIQESAGGSSTWTRALGGPVTLPPAASTEIVSGCAYFRLAQNLRAAGRDGLLVERTSPVLSFHPVGTRTDPRATFRAASCLAGGPPATGIHIDVPPGGLSWAEPWWSPGGIVSIRGGVTPDPAGTPITRWELLLDGTVIHNVTGLSVPKAFTATVDLQALPEGPHTLSERYVYPPGQDGLLGSCPQSTSLTIDRTPPAVDITAPAAGATLCGSIGNGFSPVVVTLSESAEKTLYVDGQPAPGPDPDQAGLGFGLNLRKLSPGEHIVQVMAVDPAGNSGCDSLRVVVGTAPDLSGPSASPEVFSPLNPSGRPTEATIDFTPNVAGTYTLEVLDSGGAVVRTATGPVIADQTYAFAWDGKNGSGAAAPEGLYAAEVQLDGACGGSRTRRLPRPGLPRGIELDRTAPQLTVSAPAAGATVGAVVEVKGLVSDPNFESTSIQVLGIDGCGTCVVEVASGSRQTKSPDASLGGWGTSGVAPGAYTLRVEAIDVAGNLSRVDRSVTVRERRLIRAFERTPSLISPNADGQLDTVDVSYELVQTALVTLRVQDASAQTVRALVPRQQQTGTLQVSWDGRNDAGVLVSDGAYTLELLGEDPVNPPQLPSETERLSVEVDRTPPVLLVSGVTEAAVYAPPVSVTASLDDAHPETATITLGASGGVSETLLNSTGTFSNRLVAVLQERPDGDYELSFSASDAAGNRSTLTRHFALDGAGPSAHLDAPVTGSFHGTRRDDIIVDGVASAFHLTGYTVAVAPGASPAEGDFQTLATGTAPGRVTYRWNALGRAEGPYTLRLQATDVLNRVSRDLVVVTLDDTKPAVTLTAPAAGATVTGTLDVVGSVADTNLDSWTLELLRTSGAPQILASGTTAAAGPLHHWTALPPDGSYRLRLRGVDRAGSSNELEIPIEVAATPLEPPRSLGGLVRNRRDVVLGWQAPSGGGTPSGYDVYRGAARLNASPVTALSYTDSGLGEGRHTYTVRTVGTGGRQSAPSNAVSVTVDLTTPTASIASPSNGSRRAGTVPVLGTAHKERDFKEYRLTLVPAGATSGLLVARGAATVVGGLLGTLDSVLSDVVDGSYVLHLEAEDVFGNVGIAEVSITLDNTPPAAPVLVSAVASALDPDGRVNDVTVTFTHSPVPPDRAGFYVYRNGALTNAPAPLIGSQTPYLVAGSPYASKNLPDGTYVFDVTSADTIGNESPASNPSSSIVIDTQRPRATLASPASGSTFEGTARLRGATVDNDVVSVRFEWKLVADATWTLLAVDTDPPYQADFTPGAHGDYNVRLIASDSVGPDAAPITYTLLERDTNPPAPGAVTGRVNGADVLLSWTLPANVADLAGFVVRRDLTTLTATPLPPTARSYTDSNVPLFFSPTSFSYVVRSVDAGGRTADATVFLRLSRPAMGWLPPVTAQSHATMQGQGTNALDVVELQKEVSGSFGAVQAAVASAVAGVAFQPQALTPGLNVFRLVATDAAGNRTRPSEELSLVRHEPPAAPTGLSASVAGSDVTLSWTSTPDAESAGYQVYRDGVLRNETVGPRAYDAGTDTLLASSGTATDWATVVDGSTATGWTPVQAPLLGDPAFWQLTTTAPFELRRTTLQFQSGRVPSKLDLDVLVDGRWMWMGTFAPPTTSLTVDVGIRVWGVRMRVCNCSNITLVEVQLERTTRTLTSPFVDSGLVSGAYLYAVRERNRWGQAGETTSAVAFVGIPAPAAPTGLTVTPGACGELALSWAAVSPAPSGFSGYRVYRSTSAGGPFQLVGSVGTTTTTFTDTDLLAGAYHYALATVVTVSGRALESALSPSQSATAACASPPLPVITGPTTTGTPYTASRPTVTVQGKASVGAALGLRRNGQDLGLSTTAAATLTMALPAKSRRPVAVSRDGRRVAYVGTSAGGGDVIVVLDLLTGDTSRVAEGASRLDEVALDPTGRQVAYLATRSGLTNAFLYDLTTQIETPVTGDADEKGSLAFSPDGSALIYVSASSTSTQRRALSYALATSATRQLLSTTASTPSNPVFSADGSKLCLTSPEGLTLIDLPTLATRTLGPSTPGATLSTTAHAFAPDGATLVLSEVSGGAATSARLLSWNLGSGATTPLATPTGAFAGAYLDAATLVYLQALPGGSLSVVRRTLSSSTERIVASGLQTSGLVAPDDSRSALFLGDGRAFLLQEPSLLVAELSGGSFRFADVPLLFGTSTFVARQSAAADSAPIDVVLPAASFPDASVSELAATVLSGQGGSVPLIGESVLLQGLVKNLGQAPLTNASLAFRLRYPSGALLELSNVALSLGPSEESVARTTWDTSGLAPGDYVVEMVADAEAAVVETDEANNAQSLAIPLRAARGAELKATLDRTTYPLGDTAFLTVALLSSLPPTTLAVTSRIEDASGGLTELLERRSLASFGPGQASYILTFAVRDVSPGSYRARVTLTEGSTQLGEVLVSFNVEGRAYVTAKVSTDRTSYAAGTPANVTGEVTNLGAVSAVGLVATLGIETQAGVSVATSVRPLSSIPPAGHQTLSWAVDTRGLAAGNYRATLLVRDGTSTIVASAAPFAFAITQSPVASALGGSVTLSPTKLEPRTALLATATVTSSRAVPATRLTLALVDPATGQAVQTRTRTLDLTTTPFSYQESFVTDALALQHYVVTLTAEPAGSSVLPLASASAEVTDLTPPQVTLLSPSPGIHCDTVEVKARATDALSGVLRVFYRVDGAGEFPLVAPLVDAQADLYSAAWTLQISQAGAHRLEVYAEDPRGNRSTAATVDITVDVLALELLVDAPLAGSCRAEPVSVALTTTAATGRQLTATLDGTPYAFGTPISQEGTHHLLVRGVDACGHERIRSASFVIDTTPPQITVSGITDGGSYARSVTLSWLASDSRLVSAEAALDGKPVGKSATVTAPGSHVLVVSAVDCAGNRTSRTISFTVTP